MSRSRYILVIAMIVAAFAFTGSTHAQQAGPPGPPLPAPPAPTAPPLSISGNYLNGPVNTTPLPNPQPPPPGGGAVGAAIRSGQPLPDAPVQSCGSGGNSQCWFFQLLGYVTTPTQTPPWSTSSVQANLIAFSASNLPSQNVAYGRESYFVQLVRRR